MQTTTRQRTVSRIGLHRATQFLWNETQGLIFSCYFRKKDGTMREMVCRRGVKKHLRGGSLPYDAKANNLLPVFDMTLGEYRTVNLATLVSFNFGDETFVVM